MAAVTLPFNPLTPTSVSLENNLTLFLIQVAAVTVKYDHKGIRFLTRY